MSIKYFFGLPCLHAEEVKVCFVNELMANQPHNEKVRKFTNYVFEYYINHGSKFSLEFSQNLLQRLMEQLTR